MEQEKLMYQLMHNLSQTDKPIIFKGAMVTKIIMANNNVEYDRQTKDIDANWFEANATVEQINDVLDIALQEIDPGYFAINIRPFANKRSAGFAIFHTDSFDNFDNSVPIFTMDISCKPNIGFQNYSIDDLTFKGVLPTEILADKIHTISHNTQINRRPQDIMDVYNLSHCVSFNSLNIISVCENKDRTLGDFNIFLTKKERVQEKYERNLSNIENKPDFETVYKHLNILVEPFTDKAISTQMWNPEKLKWESLIPITESSTKAMQKYKEIPNRYLDDNTPVCKNPENEINLNKDSECDF